MPSSLVAVAGGWIDAAEGREPGWPESDRLQAWGVLLVMLEPDVVAPSELAAVRQRVRLGVAAREAADLMPLA